MAKILNQFHSDIFNGKPVKAIHLTQFEDALTGIDDYDIRISGSLVVTGSLTTTNTITLQEGSNIYFKANKVGSGVLALGSGAGNSAAGVVDSTLLGINSGNNVANSYYVNILGYYAGRYVNSANYCNLIGHKAGFNQGSTSGTSIGSNNTIIGTNVSLPGGTKDYFNLGGVLFISSSYNNLGTVTEAAKTTAKVGIGTLTPSSSLHVIGGVQIGNDDTLPSAGKVGTFRYRESAGISYLDVCMRSGSTYIWHNLQEYTYV